MVPPLTTIALKSVARIAIPVRESVKQTVATGRIGRLRADYGLDLLNLFIADVQTGFGPFIAVYLTARTWTPAEIGAALSVGAVIAMLAQVPAGALIDAVPRKRLGGGVALAAVGLSAMLLALFPTRGPVLTAEVLHGVASCLLGPSVAAITLSRVGRRNLGERLGRNARFSAMGAVIGAGTMGALGTWWSAQSVFWVAAALTLPAIVAIMLLPPRHETEPRPETVRPVRAAVRKAGDEGWRVLLDRRLLIFCGCVVMFHLSNAAMLPLAAGALTGIAGIHANLVVAAALMVPQAIVALLSPFAGRLAERRGRRLMLMLGFAALPARGLLLAVFTTPEMVIATQALDGIGGAVMGVALPLLASDITRGTNRFNFCLGLFGLAVGLGASLGLGGSGLIATHFGHSAAFCALAGVGGAGLLLVALAMPETKPGEGGEAAPKPSDPLPAASAGG